MRPVLTNSPLAGRIVNMPDNHIYKMDRGPYCDPPADNAHEVVKRLHLELLAEHKSMFWLARKSGIGKKTLQDWWRAKRNPTVMNLEAALNVFGLKLKVTNK